MQILSLTRFRGLFGVIAFCSGSAIMAQTLPGNVVFQNGEVSLLPAERSGDPVKDREIFANLKQGNCLTCRANSDMSEQSFHGENGPLLDGVASRWEEAELREILVDAKVMFAGVIMPAIDRDHNFERPRSEYVSKIILTAQQIEDVPANMLTLREE